MYKYLLIIMGTHPITCIYKSDLKVRLSQHGWNINTGYFPLILKLKEI